MPLESIYTDALDREVLIRPEGSSDRQVWADTFTGLYHVPPASMPDPARVLDLGSNIGLTTAHYRKMWPDALIVGVEMAADSVALAQRNEPDALFRQHAVAGQEGIGSYDPFLLEEAFAYDANNNGIGRIEVAAFTLRQTIFRAFGTHWPVDFVKMDIEGAEWDVFSDGTWAEHVRHLLVELHPLEEIPPGDEGNTILANSAIEYLTTLGFEAQRFTRHPRAVWAWH